MVEDDKLRKWGRFGVVKNAQIGITDKINDEPSNEYFSNYKSWIEKNISIDVSEYLVPLNPPPVPFLQQDVSSVNFLQSFNDVTEYILYAAEACQRLRVNEEINRRSRLRWFSVLADIYDEYKSFIAKFPSLKSSSPRVTKASEIADEVKKDKLKRTALAKEVMAGRRINRILKELKGQWHIIDFLDFITKDLLVNNSQEFIDNLVQGIRWPMMDITFPYKTLSSGSTYQYYLPSLEPQPLLLDD